MKVRVNVFLVAFVFFAAQLYAQQNQAPPAQAQPLNDGAVAAPMANNTGIDLSKYKKVMIDDFENAELWEVEIPRDSGFAVTEKKEGGPRNIKNDQNRYVLGLKVSFFKTGSSAVALKPVRPVVIQDIVKGFSIWAVGRGFPNELKVLFKEPVGRQFRAISLGKLSFYGWQKLEAPLPSKFEDQSFQAYFRRTPGGEAPMTTSPFTGDDIRFFSGLASGAGDLKQGLEVNALYIEVEPQAAKGVYYSYFDNFEASVDSSARETLDQIDNQLDAW